MLSLVIHNNSEVENTERRLLPYNGNNKDINSPYRNQSHMNRAFDMMKTMRERNLFCDVILETDSGSEIQAHKMVLASCSPYFLAMFTNFEEKGQSRVKLQDIDSLALELLISYVYSAEIFVTSQNVQVLLHAASLLQLNDVCDACCDFLQSELHPSNCLDIQDIADIYGCSELAEEANIYTEQHFPEIIRGGEFSKFSPHRVIKLISSDHLAVPSEEIVFECVISWINADPKSRRNHLNQLMEHVRLPLLSQEYFFERVAEEPLVKSNSLCHGYLIEALKYHSLEGQQKTFLESHRTKHREPRGLGKLLMVIGGDMSELCRTVECLDMQSGEWYEVSPLSIERCAAGCAVVGGQVYVVGGSDGSANADAILRTVDVYNSFTNQWTPGAEMKTARSAHGVASSGNRIYAVGGFYGDVCLNSAEVYDSWTKKWRMISPMSMKRCDVGVGVVNGLLYAVGGYDLDVDRNLSSVECYNPEKDEWRMVAEMSIERNGVGVGSINGILYAIGGADNNDPPVYMNCAEAYNPETDQWYPIASMIHCRSYAGVVAFNEMLYVVGGEDNGEVILDSVEVYSPRTNSWTILPGRMGCGKKYISVAVIDKQETAV